MAIDFSISSSVLANGRTAYSAQRLNSNEPKFAFGYRTMYLDNYGLFNTSVNSNLVYKAEEFEDDHGFWAYFIYPTAMAESKGSFLCLNTYDRAKFTFTFMQYAAHVANGDFVLFFKKLLALPNAKDYFPKLVLQNNQIFYRNAAGVLNALENHTSTQALMDYLNPTLAEIDQQELITATRFVHWASNDIAHRKIQVETAVNMYRDNMADYHERFDLNGAPAKVCLMVCDIRHQGRGKNDRIALALNTHGDYEKAFSNLCTIGNTNYQSRINTVRNTIKSLEQAGLFSKNYDAEKKEFV